MLALFQRNAWATERLLDFCATQPAGVLTAPGDKDVLGPIDVQLTHLVAGEVGLLPRVTGERREDRIGGDRPLPLEDLREPMRWVAERWPAALDFDRDPEVVFQIQRRTGPADMTDWVVLLHFLHHGDDHRAQIGTQLGRDGIEGPELDLWAYFEAEGSGRPHEDASARPRRDSVLRRGFEVHEWATEALLARCVELPADQLGLTAPGTFGSILDTLDHMVSSNRSYLSRLQGTGRQPRLNAGAVERLREHFGRTSVGWLAYLDSKPDFDQEIEMQDGTKVPAWVIVAQALHHGNDHRTHIGTVMMHHGLSAPSVTPWDYFSSLIPA